VSPNRALVSTCTVCAQQSGGDDPVTQRAVDAAVCWRVALQINTPSARRLCAWKLPDRRWEMSTIRKHDDFEP
jgi:hypothetical protein